MGAAVPGEVRCSRNLATASKRSGWRGTRIKRKRGCCGARRRKISTAICSSGSCVLPARKTMSSSAMPASWRALRARIVAIGLGAVVLERAGDDDAIGGAPRCAKPLGRFLVLGGDEVDLPQARRQRAAECGDNRGSCDRSAGRLTIATRAPCPSRPQSDSATAPTRRAPASLGRRRRMAFRTAQLKSSGQ